MTDILSPVILNLFQDLLTMCAQPNGILKQVQDDDGLKIIRECIQ